VPFGFAMNPETVDLIVDRISQLYLYSDRVGLALLVQVCYSRDHAVVVMIAISIGSLSARILHLCLPLLRDASRVQTG
jgi:hypothetical protein